MALSVEDRKAKIKARRGLQRSIARRLGVSEGHISQVLSGEREASDRVKREIARRLKLPIEEVFPPPADEQAAAVA